MSTKQKKLATPSAVAPAGAVESLPPLPAELPAMVEPDPRWRTLTLTSDDGVRHVYRLTDLDNELTTRQINLALDLLQEVYDHYEGKNQQVRRMLSEHGTTEASPTEESDETFEQTKDAANADSTLPVISPSDAADRDLARMILQSTAIPDFVPKITALLYLPTEPVREDYFRIHSYNERIAVMEDAPYGASEAAVSFFYGIIARSLGDVNAVLRQTLTTSATM